MARKSSGKITRRSLGGGGLSTRTRNAISGLPLHAQHIYKRAHNNGLKQYKSPSKRRGGKRQSREQVAHKVAWAAVKKGRQVRSLRGRLEIH